MKGSDDKNTSISVDSSLGSNDKIENLLDNLDADKSSAETSTNQQKLPRKVKFWLISTTIFIGLTVSLIFGVRYWYYNSLKPLSTTQTRVKVDIQSGSTAKQIGALLEEKGVIRSELAFSWHVRSSGLRSQLKAGNYLLSPSQSSQDIASMIAAGKTNLFNIVILPGQTIEQIKTQLEKDGFSETDIQSAFNKTYTSKLFATKPPKASLEGYIFPDTYQIDDSTSVEQLLERVFANFLDKIDKNNVASSLKRQNITLHQAIILSSIVEKEDSNPTTQPQIAQVFLKRLNSGIPLGSDVTALYGAKKAGQELTGSIAEQANQAVAFNSPYNTRIHKGLPPGPIANFGFSALESIASPAKGDYLYFVAGDDGKVHFATTEDGHNANIQQYCHKLCQ